MFFDLDDPLFNVDDPLFDLDAAIFCETLLFVILFIDARFEDSLFDTLFFAANSIPIFPSIFTQRFVFGLSILPLGQSAIVL
jgi:hypothetical protein